MRRVSGSSPRVRGSLLIRWALLYGHGIIPAGAGLTAAEEMPLPFTQDHPRGCGAHSSSICNSVSSRGSSPRVRGSPSRDGFCKTAAGIIPAGAGLTSSLPMSLLDMRDHPRGCGAHHHKAGKWIDSTGSSPRVRGSRELQVDALQLGGIIPAGAGLTFILRH